MKANVKHNVLINYVQLANNISHLINQHIRAFLVLNIVLIALLINVLNVNRDGH